MEKQFILFPMHKNDHWRLFIVANSGLLEANSKDFMPNAEHQLTCILHLDSYNENPKPGEVKLIEKNYA